MAVWTFYVIAGLIGVATVFFDVGYQPAHLGAQRAGGARQRRLGVTAQIARLGGPSVAGALLTIVAAPWLMLINAVGFACSAVFLGGIRDDAQGEGAVTAGDRVDGLVRAGGRFSGGRPTR